MAGLPPGLDPSYVQDFGDAGYTYNGVSSDPSLAVGGSQYTSPQAAAQAWFAANPSYGQYNPADLGGQLNNIQSGIAPQQAQTPANQAIAGGYNPLQPAYLGAPPTINATTAQGQTYNPSGYNPTGYNAANTGAAGYGASQLGQGLLGSLGTGATVQALQNSVAPTYGQQDQQLMQMLAASGVSPGSTAGTGIFGNLAQEQLAGISPAMASAIQNSQANQLNAGQFNTGALNTAGQFNAGNQQAVNLANQASQNAAGQFNAGAANTGGQFNAGAQNTAGQYNAGNLQQAGQFNANAQNTASGQNLTDLLNQQLYNANAYNTAGNNYFGALTGAYNSNANAFNALNTAGLSGAQNLASQQASGGNAFANNMQTQYPVYQSQPLNYGAFGGAPSGGSSTTNYYSNPYGSAQDTTANLPTGDY